MNQHGIESGSCSCSSCVYKSHLNRSSVQQLIEERSRINRLYYGKYLPLRERTLFEKLIRTRAVYDDLRSQLLSYSGSSDLTRLEHKIRRQNDNSTDIESSTVLQIVDLIDRGQIKSTYSSKLSCCCSCCSCSTLRKIRKYMDKYPPPVHRHHIPCEEVDTYVIETERKGRKRQKRIDGVRKKREYHNLNIDSGQDQSHTTASKQAKKIKKTYSRVQIKSALGSVICTSTITSASSKTLLSKGSNSLSEIKSLLTNMEIKMPKTPKQEDQFILKEPVIQKNTYSPQKTIPYKLRETQKFTPKSKSQIVSKETINNKDNHKLNLKTRHSRVQNKSTLRSGFYKCRPTVKSTASVTLLLKTSGSLSEIKSPITNMEIKTSKLPKQKSQFLSTKPVTEVKDCKPDSFKSKTYFLHKLHEKYPLASKSYIEYTKDIETKADTIDRHNTNFTANTSLKIMKTTNSRLQTELILRSAVSKCTTKSASSVTSFSKISKSLSQLKSLIPDMVTKIPQLLETQLMLTDPRLQKNIDRYKPKITVSYKLHECEPKLKSQIVTKDTILQGNVFNKDRHDPNLTKSYTFHETEREQIGSIACECKQSIKSTASITIILKSRPVESVSQTEIKLTHVKPKSKTPLVKNNSIFKNKAFTNDHHKLNKKEVQISSKIKPERISCVCKPSTKSTAVTKSKVPKSTSKRKMKINKPKKIKLYKRGLCKPKKFCHKYYETELKDEVEETIFNIKLSKRRHPVFINKKFMEPGNKNKVKLSTISKPTRETLLSHQSQVSHFTKCGCQVSKFGDEVLSLPKECESSMCIPYSYDPENCVKIPYKINSRGESTMYNTDLLTPKSIGSITSTFISHSKSRYIQSKSMGRFITKTRKQSKIPPPKSGEKDVQGKSCHQNKQDIKTSNYSFNIEYNKVRTHNSNEQKVNRKSNSNKGNAQSLQSTRNIRIGHKIKRCFCTLKLFQKKNKNNNSLASKKIKALHVKDLDKKALVRYTQTQSSGISYVIPPATSPSVLLYKCEPVFCTLVERNSHKCTDRIKAKNDNRRSFDTLKKSTLTLTSKNLPKLSSAKLRSVEYEEKKEKIKRQMSNMATKVSYQKPNKHDIFTSSAQGSKINNNQPSAHDKEFAFDLSNRSVKKEREPIQQNGIKVYKPRIRYVSLETTKNVEVKEASTTPFLQKCFCTLKLFNKHKKKTGLPLQNDNDIIPLQNDNHLTRNNNNDLNIHRVNKFIKTNTVNIRYQHVQPKHLPYKYDPNECKRIGKLRTMKLFPDDLLTKTTFSETLNINPSSTSPNQLYSKKSREKETNDLIDSTNQSNLNFNNMALKNSFSAKKMEKANKEIKRSRVVIDPCSPDCSKKVKMKSAGSEQLKSQSRHKIIYEEARGKNKRNYVGPTVKKCFCTLKFHKKGKNEKFNDNSNVSTKTIYPLLKPQIYKCSSTITSYPLSKPDIGDCKSARTKESKPIYHLKNDKYSSDICSLRIGNNFECYQERQRLRLLRNHNIDTENSKRKYPASMTFSEFYGSSKFKSTQSRLTKEPDNRTKVIQRDMRTTRSFSPAHQAVSIGSNISRNIDFSMDQLATSLLKTTYNSQAPEYNTVTSIKSGEKQAALQYHNSQASNIIRKHDKSLKVGFLLKRCFYALSFQKKHMATDLKIPYRNSGNQPTAAQYVQVLHGDSNKAQTFEYDNSNKTQHFIYIQNITKSRSSNLKKTSFKELPLHKNPLEGSYPVKENIVGKRRKISDNTNLARHLVLSHPITKRSHLDVNKNIDKGAVMSPFDQCDEHILSDGTRRDIPFYQTFYAFNARVLPPDDTNDIEFVEYNKNRRNRRRRSKLSVTDPPRTESVQYVTPSKYKTKNKTTEAYLNKQSRNLNNNSRSYKGDEPARQLVRVGSHFNFSMEFFKQTMPATNSALTKKTTQENSAGKRDAKRKYRYANSQTDIENQSDFLLTNSDKDEGTTVRNPYGNIIVYENRNMMTDKLEPYECAPYICVPEECDPYECYEIMQRRSKTLKEQAAGTNTEYKTVKVKEKDLSKKIQGPEKRRVIYRSDSSSESATYDRPRTYRNLGVSPHTYTTKRGSGDNRTTTRDRGINKRSKFKDQGTRYKASRSLSKCFCTLKLVKHGREDNLKYGVQPGPPVVSSVKEKHVRSQTTKVYRKKEYPSTYHVDSAVSHKGTTTKGKLITSFECDPCNCDVRASIEDLMANRIFGCELGKKIKKTKSKVANKSHLMNKEKKQTKSVINRCLCALTYQNIINTCTCSLKTRKLILTPKRGKETITEPIPINGKSKQNRDQRLGWKLKKQKSNTNQSKQANNKEDEIIIIMPYSKKKFHKFESKVELRQATTNTTIFAPSHRTKNLSKKKYIKKRVQFFHRPKYQPNLRKFPVSSRSNKVSDKFSDSPLHPKSPVGDYSDLSLDPEYNIASVNLKKHMKGKKMYLDTTLHLKEQVGEHMYPRPDPEYKKPNMISKNLRKDKNKPLHLFLHPEVNSDLCSENKKHTKRKIKNEMKKKNKNSLCVCFTNDPTNQCPVSCKASLQTFIKSEPPKTIKRRSDKQENKGVQSDIRIDWPSSCKAKYTPIVNQIKHSSHKTILANRVKHSTNFPPINDCIKHKNDSNFQANQIIPDKPIFQVYYMTQTDRNMTRYEVPPTIQYDRKARGRQVRQVRPYTPQHEPYYTRTVYRRPQVIKDFRKIYLINRKPKPLMEVLVDKNSACIMNSEEILQKLIRNAELKKLNAKSKRVSDHMKRHQKRLKARQKCLCCICRRRRGKRNPLTWFSAKPCICGSISCKKKYERLKRENKALKSFKDVPLCDCGTDICRKARFYAEAEKKYFAERKARQEHYDIIDKKRAKRRQKQDDKAMEHLMKTRTSKSVKLTDSLRDLRTFGTRSFGDAMRWVWRSIRHPRDGVYNVRELFTDDETEKKKKSILATNFSPTAARIKKRFTTKHKKKREVPSDLECNVFMATLRKKPCMWIYYVCPWFYPHFVGLITVWKRFTEIILFILAIGIWSPCIICMELCRAMLCCLLCTR